MMFRDVTLSRTHVLSGSSRRRQRTGVFGVAGRCPQMANVSGYCEWSSTRPYSANVVHRALPARPFFVVTTMTPLDASVPYSVAADGPFTTSTSWMSSGLRPFRNVEFAMLPPAPFAVKLPALKRTPSTIQIGALLNDSELVPRMRIVPAVPVVAPGRTTTPGIFATSRSEMFDTGVSSTRLVTSSSVETVLPNSTRRCCPVAVVTTSASFTTLGARMKSTVVVPPAVTVTGFFCSVKPTRIVRTSPEPAGTPLSVYRPSALVEVASALPTRYTRASPSGAPDAWSVTRPVIEVPPCAAATSGAASKAAPPHTLRNHRWTSCDEPVRIATVLGLVSRQTTTDGSTPGRDAWDERLRECDMLPGRAEATAGCCECHDIGTDRSGMTQGAR